MRRRSTLDGFGYVSRAERRAADLFFASLTGRRLLPAWRPVALPSYPAEDDPKDCGVFGPGKARMTVPKLQEAIAAVAMGQWKAWHASGAPVLESDASRFWLLVAYYLSADGGISADEIKVLHANAPTASYSALLAPTLKKDADIDAAARGVQGDLVKGLTSPTAAFKGRVETAIKSARKAHFDADPWSGAFVSAVVRGTAIMNGLETTPNDLLKVSTKHMTYVREAWDRKPGRLGTYQAFAPGTRDVSVGDIVVMDRQARIEEKDVTKLGPSMKTDVPTHGDIVVELGKDSVVTVGGNVCHSVRQRRYPVTSKRLVVDRDKLVVQENSLGQLSTVLPDTCHEDKALLHPQSAARVFAHLILVEACRTPPATGSGSGAG